MDSILERRRAYEERMSRIASVEDRMNALVNGQDGSTGLADSDTDGLLQEALKALLGLALRREDFELEVALPGRDGRGFRMIKRDGDLQLQLLPEGDRSSPGARDAGETRQVTAELANLLRGR